MTTYAVYVTAISGLSVTGVARTFDHQPESLGAADMPAQFVRLPSGDSGYAPVECRDSFKQRVIELVICLEPAALETASQNFDDTVVMMDYMETALDAWDTTWGEPIIYTIATSGDTPVIVGDTAYWAVIATVTTGIG